MADSEPKDPEVKEEGGEPKSAPNVSVGPLNLSHKQIEKAQNLDAMNPLLKSPSVRGPMIKSGGQKRGPRDLGQRGEVNRRHESFRRSPNPRRPLYTSMEEQEKGLPAGIEAMTPRSDRFTVEEVQQILSVLQEVSGGRVEITQKKFEEVLVKLEAKGFSALKNTALQSRMFELFDADGNRSLDARELIAGLSLVCKGTPQERLRLTFDLYDADGSGTLNRAELFQGLKSAHEHAVELQSKEGGKPTESRRAAITKVRDCVDDVMRTFDVDGSSTIDFKEFCAWGMRSPFINLVNESNPDLNVYLTVGAPSPPDYNLTKSIELQLVSANNFPSSEISWTISPCKGGQGDDTRAAEGTKFTTTDMLEVKGLWELKSGDVESYHGLIVEFYKTSEEEGKDKVGESLMLWSFIQKEAESIVELPVAQDLSVSIRIHFNLNEPPSESKPKPIPKNLSSPAPVSLSTSYFESNMPSSAPIRKDASPTPSPDVSSSTPSTPTDK